MRSTILALVLACAACAGADLSETGEAAASRPRSYLVLAKTEAALPATLAKDLAKKGGKVTASLPAIGLVVAETSDPGFAAKAQKLAGVRSVVPDTRRHFHGPQDARVQAFTAGGFAGGGEGAPLTKARTATATVEPTDWAYPLQWGPKAVGAPDAWAKGNFGQGVRVAVLDTGIIWWHPDLFPNLDMEDSVSYVPGEDVFVDSDLGYNYHGA